MKTPIVFLFLILSITSYAQKSLQQYKASNGVIYHVGDTIRVNRGSGIDGRFLYFTGNQALDVSLTIWNHSKWRIREITSSNDGFIINFGLGEEKYSKYLKIEDAIATCEITPCAKQSGVDKYDRLKKIKELLDNKTLTQEEYEKEKAKILAED